MNICHRCHVPLDESQFIDSLGRHFKTCHQCRGKMVKEYHKLNTGAAVIIDGPQGIAPFPLRGVFVWEGMTFGRMT